MNKTTKFLTAVMLLVGLVTALTSFAADTIVEAPNLLRVIVEGAQGAKGEKGDAGPPGDVAIVFSNGSTVTVPVKTVFGRKGEVVPQAGDYTAAQVGADPSGTAALMINNHNTTYKHDNIPTDGQVAAFGGTYGTPSMANKFVTETDPRNTNARTPTSHGSTHRAGGSDPMVLSSSQVTGLDTALASKQPLLNNSITISKITEAGNLPLWNGGAWPGGGGGGGDMYKFTYDPRGINGDAFALSNHTGSIPSSSVSGLVASATTDTTTTSNIADSTNKRFITDAQRSVLINTSNSNTGDVTLGASNGLSLSGQQLSLALATNSAAGALSAADHATFANGASLAATASQPSHTHDGSVVVSGTIDGDRLPVMSNTKKGAVPPTGIPSGKFLKDDGTWGTAVTSSGVTTINGSTVGIQTIASGSNVAVSSNALTGVHTIGITGSIPDANIASASTWNAKPSLTNTAPNMDGIGSAGSGSTAARVDHVHPLDTSRAPVDTPTFTGTVTAPAYVSNAADGGHYSECSNSGAMTTTGWGTTEEGRWCYDKTLHKFRYWSGSALSDLAGTGSSYTLPDATTSTKGGVTISGTTTVAGSVSGTKTAGKQLAFDSNGNIIASAYAVGASGGGGSGTVGSGAQYHLPWYGSAGTAVSDSGVVLSSDSTSLTLPQSTTAADSVALRAQSSYGTNAVSVTVQNAAITPWSLTLPATAPADGCVNIAGGVIGSTGAACKAGTVTSVTASNSLASSGGTAPAISLAGDSATPGASMLYGTDASGVKGWYTQPSGGSTNLASPGPIGNTTPSTGAFTALSATSDNPWVTQTDNGAAISSSNPAWRIAPMHSDGKYHFQYSDDGTTFADTITISRGKDITGVGAINGASLSLTGGATLGGRMAAKTYAATIPGATADGSTITFDLQAGDSPSTTLGGNRTLAFSSPVAGQWYRLNLIQDATGNRTVTWPSTGLVCTWRNTTNNAAPTLLTGANKVDTFIIHVLSSTSAECWTAGNQ